MTRHYHLAGKRVWVAGHRGMVGAALLRRLQQENCQILTAERADLNLLRQAEVEDWMARAKPQAVILAAARVGGIHANNSYPVDFLYENLMIETNCIKAAHDQGVEKLLFLGSSCIYPKLATQPITEDALLTGPLEPTNQWYAVAKIAGIKLAQAYRRQHGRDFICAMPTNLYGPGDNFDLQNSHVIPALLRKAHEAKLRGDKQLVIWGSGTPLREFLHVDDCADALVHVMTHYSAEQHINIGSGEDLPIRDLAQLVAQAVGFDGEIVADRSKPDGTPRKLMSADKLRNDLGWTPRIALRDGLKQTYRWFLAQQDKGLLRR
jgi:GDP-L-fucose synthase|tara:strand:- start:3176 stop:4138 length:963 start_codon:yes stop_codon:yes gene_type:complete